MSARGATRRPALELLESAERRVATEADRVREDAATPDEVVRTSAALVAEVLARASGTSLPETSPASVLARRVLGMLRANIVAAVASADPPPPTAELVPVLVAMEEVEARLAPTWDQRFADRMSGPDGLELVVERVEGKAKLSQNRSEEDRAGVVRGLRAEGGPREAVVADRMESL